MTPPNPKPPAPATSRHAASHVLRTFANPTLLLTLLACSAPSNPTQFVPPDRDATVAVPGYCNMYCEEQQNDGTLTGTLQECVTQCCESVPRDCAGMDGGGATDSGPGPDVGSRPDSGVAQEGGGGDGSTCAHPCGNLCCTGNDACVMNDGGQPLCVATCKVATDCPTQCCAPMTDSTGEPVGPYICKANDANAYDCCTGLTNFCGDGFCCVADTNGNEFCATECTSSSSCGAAKCDTFSFSHTTCFGPTACGP